MNPKSSLKEKPDPRQKQKSGAKQEPGRNQKQKNKRPRQRTRGELRTHLEIFFSQYAGFKYDPAKPYMGEFYRMTNQFGWESKSDEFQEARKKINDASVLQFNAIYGQRNSISSWRNLCSVLDIAEIPKTMDECRTVSTACLWFFLRLTVLPSTSQQSLSNRCISTFATCSTPPLRTLAWSTLRAKRNLANTPWSRGNSSRWRAHTQADCSGFYCVKF